MLSETAITFVSVATILCADGSELVAFGDNYPSFEQCIIQAEHDVKVMAREIEDIESTLPHRVITGVRIECEPMGNTFHPGGSVTYER